ncbi:hypothetical protein DL347_13060 [Pseudomonas fluorescens]|uniref:Uncharacterized protein n=1 Tax=Pseudomonas fluorescens TaxID=294 RepID=A0A7Z6MZ15_PSEFL|nr:hypothetical protein DL347_13060 [Pseudomonas fluorescens]
MMLGSKGDVACGQAKGRNWEAIIGIGPGHPIGERFDSNHQCYRCEGGCVVQRHRFGSLPVIRQALDAHRVKG